MEAVGHCIATKAGSPREPPKNPVDVVRLLEHPCKILLGWISLVYLSPEDQHPNLSEATFTPECCGMGLRSSSQFSVFASVKTVTLLVCAAQGLKMVDIIGRLTVCHFVFSQAT